MCHTGVKNFLLVVIFFLFWKEIATLCAVIGEVQLSNLTAD